MHTKIELNCCPNCGNMDPETFTNNFDYWIRCPHCQQETGRMATYATAVKAWNFTNPAETSGWETDKPRVYKKFICPNCRQFFTFLDPTEPWLCPHCKIKLLIIVGCSSCGALPKIVKINDNFHIVCSECEKACLAEYTLARALAQWKRTNS